MKRNRIQRGKVKLVNPNLKLKQEIKNLKDQRDAVISANKELIGEIRNTQTVADAYREALTTVGQASITQNFEFKWNGLFIVFFDLAVVFITLISFPYLWEIGHYFSSVFSFIVMVYILCKRMLFN